MREDGTSTSSTPSMNLRKAKARNAAVKRFRFLEVLLDKSTCSYRDFGIDWGKWSFGADCVSAAEARCADGGVIGI